MGTIKSEQIRLWSMRETYLALIPTSLLTLIFSVVNVGIINALLRNDHTSQNLDPSLYDKPVSSILSEGYLGPCYQSAVIFIPISVAVLASLAYKNGENEQLLLLGQHSRLRKLGTIFSYAIWAGAACITSAIINYLSYLILIDAGHRSDISIVAEFIVISRVYLFSVLLSLLALYVISFTKKLGMSIFLLLLLFFVQLSGIFQKFLPQIHNILPLIGGKSFAFWNNAEGPFTISSSLILLLTWILILTILYIFTPTDRHK